MAGIFRQKTGEGGDISFNMTPLIDCTFQLIIFFILASQMASKQLAKLELPRPFESKAYDEEKLKIINKVIVNVQSAAGDKKDADPRLAATAIGYQIDGKTIPTHNTERLGQLFKTRLAEMKARGGKVEDFYVMIRADKRVSYSFVVPVMKAAAKAGVEKMTLTALQR